MFSLRKLLWSRCGETISKSPVLTECSELSLPLRTQVSLFYELERKFRIFSNALKRAPSTDHPVVAVAAIHLERTVSLAAPLDAVLLVLFQ